MKKTKAVFRLMKWKLTKRRNAFNATDYIDDHEITDFDHRPFLGLIENIDV